MRIRFVLTFAFIVLSYIAKNQSFTKAFYNRSEHAYNFLLYSPSEYNDTVESFPLIIFLHGRSLSGTDLNRVRKYGVLDAIERQTVQPGALVAAPQCPKSESWEPDKVLTLLQWLKANYQIDTTRIYVVGMSLGGYGTLDFVGKYPQEVTAAAALCGGGKVKYAANLATVPLWIMHGKADNAVPYTKSVEIVEAIHQSSDTNLTRVDYYEGLGHGAMANAFYMQVFYDWLHQFDKSDSSKAKLMNYEISRADYLRRPIAAGKRKTITSDSVVDFQKPAFTDYSIKKGDTLYGLAKRFKTTVTKICELNGIKETETLQIGQKLKIPN